MFLRFRVLSSLACVLCSNKKSVIRLKWRTKKSFNDPVFNFLSDKDFKISFVNWIYECIMFLIIFFPSMSGVNLMVHIFYSWRRGFILSFLFARWSQSKKSYFTKNIIESRHFQINFEEFMTWLIIHSIFVPWPSF